MFISCMLPTQARLRVWKTKATLLSLSDIRENPQSSASIAAQWLPADLSISAAGGIQWNAPNDDPSCRSMQWKGCSAYIPQIRWVDNASVWMNRGYEGERWAVAVDACSDDVCFHTARPFRRVCLLPFGVKRSLRACSHFEHVADVDGVSET